jgi:hypothetical protein
VPVAGQRQRPAVAGEDVALVVHVAHFHLHALDRGIDIARRAAGADFFAQHVPGLDGLAQFDFDAVVDHGAEAREAEFEEGREPFELEGIAGALQVLHHVLHVLGDEVRQHVAVMQAGAPAHQALLLPE